MSYVSGARHNKNCVTVSNLSVTRGTKELYRDFSVSFSCNEITAIFGHSGSGKTTLLDCIASLHKPQGGTIVHAGSDCKNRCNTGRKSSADARADKMAVSCLFQEPRLLLWRTLLQNVMLPLENLMPPKQAKERACLFLEKTGLLYRKNDFPVNLSGGERQRTAIARAFAFPAPVLLMDEAFQSQDMGQKTHLMNLLQTLLKTEKRTVIMVSHDIYEALHLADRILVLSGSPVRVVLDEKKENTNEALLRLEKNIISALTEVSTL